MTERFAVHCVAGQADAHGVAWDVFVAAHPDAGPMHWIGWHGVLVDAFSVDPVFLAAIDTAGNVHGIVPLYFSNSLLEGRHLASLQDGILAEDQKTAELLLAAALAERDRRRAGMLIMRGGLPAGSVADATFPVVHTVVDTTRPAEKLMATLGKKVRWEIRQSRDLTFAEAACSPEELARFHRIFADHQQRLGTPAPGAAFFPAIFRHLGCRARLFTINQAGTMTGGMVVVATSQGWTSLYAAIEEQAREADGGYFLYWRVLEWMCGHGAFRFDLGRSTPDSGVHRFKKKWAGSDTIKIYGYFGERAAARIAAMNVIRSGQTLKQKVWKHLPPPVCGLIGPFIRSKLPMG